MITMDAIVGAPFAPPDIDTCVTVIRGAAETHKVYTSSIRDRDHVIYSESLHFRRLKRSDFCAV